MLIGMRAKKMKKKAKQTTGSRTKMPSEGKWNEKPFAKCKAKQKKKLRWARQNSKTQ